MMVTFVSQCEKKALKRTRRVLDSFANRIGDNTWQTIITQEGLNAVQKLLRKTASKNTAVSCLICQPYIIQIIRYSKQLFHTVTSFFLQTQQVINYH